MKCFQMGILWLFLLMFNLDRFVHPTFVMDSNSVVKSGDVMIIGLFSVHRQNGSGCGRIQESAGLQRVEAALQQIEEFNRIKNEKTCSLGIVIKDTCEGSLDLGKLESLGDSVIGIIGPATSEETDSYLSKSQPCPFIVVGYGATSTTLAKKVPVQAYQEPYDFYDPYLQEYHHSIFRPGRYPVRIPPPRKNFVQVVPTDENQVKAIVQIVKQFPNSLAINIIGTSDKYGVDGVADLRTEATKSNICINKILMADKYSNAREYFDILNNTSHFTQILVCFCDSNVLRNMLLAVKELNMTRKFIFIATDAWSEGDDVLKDLENEAEQNLFINIKSQKSYNLENNNYAILRTLTKNSENQWMQEFDSNRSNCASPNADSSSKQCPESGNFQDPKLSFVKESINVFSDFMKTNAKLDGNQCLLQQNIKQICSDSVNMIPQPRYPGHSYQVNPYSYTSRYKDDTENKNYEILNYQNVNGSFKWVPVGTWMNEIFKWENTTVKLPKIEKFSSNCRNNCTPGEHIVNSTCCWTCEACKRNNITETGGEFECIPCNEMYMSNKEKTVCIPKNEEMIYLKDADGLICIIISVFGAFITLLSAFIFYTNGEAPIIKYASPELSFIIFCGMLLAYGYSLLLVMKPSDKICTTIKFWTSISLTMIYGPLLVRINRTSRAFTVTKLREPYLKKEHFQSKFLMKIVSGFLVAQLLLIGLVDYLIFRRIPVIDINPGHISIVTFFCHKDDTNQLIFRNSINGLLLIYCCVYAFKTIKLPDNFYESKFILSSCGTTVAVWLTYILIFSLSSEPRPVQIGQSLVLSTSAFICLVGFFFPKLYIILWRPRNYKTYFSVETKVQQDLSNMDAAVTTDISIWEYLGVASRITPDVVDELVLKSSSGASTE